MRRNSLDGDSFKQQMKSVLGSSTRRILNLANNSRRMRRFSLPDNRQSDQFDRNSELDTIDENEANSAQATIDQIVENRTQISNKNNSDSSAKRYRIQNVNASSNTTHDKTQNAKLADSVGILTSETSNTAGPGAVGTVSTIHNSEHTNVVSPIVHHTNAAANVASLGSTTGKLNSAKQSISRRVRSQSKNDTQSVSDKSLFSRLFSRQKKKPMGTLITTTTTKLKDINVTKKRTDPNDNLLIKTNNPNSTIDEEDEFDDDNDQRNISAGSLSDTDPIDEKDDDIETTRSSTVTRAGSRANSGGSAPKSSSGQSSMTIPTSDSQYYASMTAAPAGFSISYHKRMVKDDDLRIQVALNRLQQQSKKATSGGTNQLMSLFQDPKRSGTQSPTLMSGTTRIKTFSGQTIITRHGSSSDRAPTYCIRSSSISPTHDTDETFINDVEIYSQFMKCHTCYDIMPKSSKLVIFDTQLAVKKAFFALVYNGVRAAPLWDIKRKKFVGLLTITDFILILQKYYKEPHAKIDELEEHRIETWREVLKEYERPLLYITPNQSLFDAVRVLYENHVHRLPIIDPISNNVIFILTHKRILRFFHLYIRDWPQPSFMSKSLEELKIGTYDNLHVIGENTAVIEALNYFVKYRVSALPVVDKNKKLVNIYSKFDVIGLAPDKSYRNLNMTINEALSYRKERFEAVAKCYKHESLSTCMERIVKAEVHRLVIVDNEDHVIGILSLSDLLYYMVIRPTTTEHSTTTIPSVNVDSDEKIE